MLTDGGLLLAIIPWALSLIAEARVFGPNLRMALGSNLLRPGSISRVGALARVPRFR
jgi:hypothetical protein